MKCVQFQSALLDHPFALADFIGSHRVGGQLDRIAG